MKTVKEMCRGEWMHHLYLFRQTQQERKMYLHHMLNPFQNIKTNQVRTNSFKLIVMQEKLFYIHQYVLGKNLSGCPSFISQNRTIVNNWKCV